VREQLFLFVRPPRPLWPFNGPSTAFWPPLAFASLAAALREQVRGLRVAILDAPACAMGWNTLAQEVQRLHPDYIGIGEEAVSCVEGLRIAKMAKSLGARIVAGGCFFGNVAPQALATGLIDVVVHGEGEQTIVELMSVLPEGRADELRRIAGISFRDGEATVFTGWREPMADLDRLPFPAYDLLPVERYGRSSRNHPAMAAIELSRGCTHACQFCALWRQMGRFRGDQPVPCLRVKSPERLVEEVRVLMDRYNRRYLGWVDPCFNAHPNVPRQLAELLLRDGRKIGQSAWVRADYLLRDEASGALSTCCDAGLNELYLGMERVSRWDLSRLGKGNLNGEPVRALEMLDARHPDVVTVGSFIYGLEGDTPESVADLFRDAQQLPIDEIIFIPLTPLPGTPYWNPAMWDATGEKLRSFDFLPRPKGDKAVDSLTAAVSWSYFTSWPWSRVRRMLGGLFAVNPRRRTIARHILTRTVPLTWAGLFAASQEQETTTGMLYPEWYES
jgi:anaerobic magnesium-protoporphyrin IX monomethyl ester cyclase